MLKNTRSVFYYGEFGYFNFIILGYLEEYFLNNNKKLAIKTYDDYFKILDHKFPGRFIKTNTQIDVPDRAKRIYHRIQNDKFNQSFIESGWTPLEDLLQCNVQDWRDARKKIKEIKSPITFGEQSKKYISILCRKRIIDLDRNLSCETWEKIIENIRSIYPEKELVLHGLKEETVDIKDCLFCSDILESIRYLNQSIIFISSMSGYAQFASNCSCSILQIGPAFQMIPYNPFQKLNLQLERSEVESIGDYLKQQSL